MGNTVSWLIGGDSDDRRYQHHEVPDKAVDLTEQCERYRQRAGEASKRSQDLSAQSQVAWQRGDKKRAKELSDLKKAEKANVEQYNRLAARAIFRENNAHRDEYTIDLHGLFVKEAERKVNGRIELLQKRHGLQELVIIVGRGSHSEDGVSRLQPAIISSLEESQFSPRMDTANPGRIRVSFDGRGSGDVGATATLNNEDDSSLFGWVFKCIFG